MHCRQHWHGWHRATCIARLAYHDHTLDYLDSAVTFGGMFYLYALDRGATQVSSKTENVSEDTAGSDLGSSSWAADNKRLLVVSLSGEQDDVVASAQGGKGV